MRHSQFHAVQETQYLQAVFKFAVQWWKAWQAGNDPPTVPLDLQQIPWANLWEMMVHSLPELALGHVAIVLKCLRPLVTMTHTQEVASAAATNFKV